jgi:hypothetical protein
MPLLDHFGPPLHPRHRWESFHSNWATRLADGLNDLIPDEFSVEECILNGPSAEIDVDIFAGAVRWPTPIASVPATFLDTFAVRVFRMRAGKTLVAAIELVSPTTKDRPGARRAFAVQCAAYLAQGVSLILVDIVTDRHANLHNETMRLMDAAPELDYSVDASIYAVAYRPVRRFERDEIDLWTERLAVGQVLPTLPLRLTGDLFVLVDFEAAYQEACRRRRLI